MPACLLLTLALLGGPATAAELPRVLWFDDSGRTAWSLPLAADPAVGEPLSAPVWLQPLGDHAVSLLDGGTLSLSSRDGRVLVLDFWATWCAPCLDELPHVQQMWRELAGRGLEVLAVNANEPDEQVRSFVEQVGLELPVGRYDAELDRLFHVGRLPTVVIVDRQGRVRARWNGYTVGQERAVAAAVRDLLDRPSDPVSMEIGTLLSGGDRLVPRWVKKGLSEISGLAAGLDADGRPRLVVSRSGEIAVLDAGGTERLDVRAPPGTGLLRAGREPGARVVGYRPGGVDMALFDPADGQSLSVRAPAPVMDVAFVGSKQGERIWVATPVGVLRLDPKAANLRPLPGSGGTLSIAGGRAGGVMTLSTEEVVTWLAADGARASEPLDAHDGWSIVSGDPAGGDGGFGVLPRRVRHATVGRFVGEGRQLAMALGDDRLLVAELSDGSPLYAARIPGIGQLAAADLDGDGHDELVAAVGRRLVVLGRAGDL